MKGTILVAICLFIFGFKSFASGLDEDGPLEFDVPEAFEVKFWPYEKPRYTITWPDSKTWFGFGYWGSKAEIPEERFEGMLKRIPETILSYATREGLDADEVSAFPNAEELEFEPIDGEVISGTFIRLDHSTEREAGQVQAFFFFHDGEDVWQGDFAGHQDALDQAVEILAKIKRKD